MTITPGQKPDLSFYYNSNWGDLQYFNSPPGDKMYNSVQKVPITADSTQPKENAIGFITPISYITNGELTFENQSILLQQWTLFLPEGSITFAPNSSYLEYKVFGDFAFSQDKTYWFKITSGTRNFLFSNGYVAIVTDPEPGFGRNCYVYFDKIEIIKPIGGDSVKPQG